MRPKSPMAFEADIHPDCGPAGDSGEFRAIVWLPHVRGGGSTTGHCDGDIRHLDRHLEIQVYCDASFAPVEHNRKSPTGKVVLINGVPVAWRSVLPSIIAHTAVEAEYVAMSDGVREAKYIVQRQLVREMGFEPAGPIVVHEDNQTAKRIAEEIATKSKHIDLKHHHVRDL